MLQSRPQICNVQNTTPVSNSFAILRSNCSVILGALLLVVALVALSGSADSAESQGEIRLRSPLSGVPYQLAIGPEGKFAAVSGRDGVVSQFDLDIKERVDLYFSPIRNEEPEKQRPIAVSPTGDLIALAAPFEVGVPDTGRIYFFAQPNRRRTLFTIDNLPARPTALQFLSDKNGARLQLIVGFANGRPPGLWDVTRVAQAAADPDREVRVSKEVSLPEPRTGFFGGCGRSECNVWTIAVPPGSNSQVGLVVGGDSGLVLYDKNLDVLTYGEVANGRPDLRRVASVSFSGDGLQFAVGKLALRTDEKPLNGACQVDVYDLRNLDRQESSDKRFSLEPNVLTPPKSSVADTDECNFARVAWSGSSVVGAGVYWSRFDQAGACKTNKDLNEKFAPEAIAMLRWAPTGEIRGEPICIGTNRVMDLKPVQDGGVAVITQDPLFAVYDANGGRSFYPGYAQERRNDGNMLDLRGATVGNERLGDMSVNEDGSVVYLRPFSSLKSYIGFDLKTTGLGEPLLAVTRREAAEAKSELIGNLQRARGAENLTFITRPQFPERCLGQDIPAGKTLQELIADFNLNDLQRKRLQLRSPETIRDVEFLEPFESGGIAEWRVVFATSHRILYLDCAGHDLWQPGLAIGQSPIVGMPVRDDAYQVRISGNRRFLIAAHGDGVVRWYELSSGRIVWSIFVARDLRSWIAWAPDGHFDSSQDLVSWSIGWLQSIARGNGVWSVTMEPLAKYEREWREPNLLRNRISRAAINTNLARAAPDQGDVTVTIEKVVLTDADIATATATVRIENFYGDEGELRSKLEIRADGIGVVSPTRFSAESKAGYILVEEEFRLGECLQEDGKNFNISARFKDKNSPVKRVKYEGRASAVQCKRPRVFGIFLGISSYKSLPGLNYADQDAQRFFDFWSKGAQADSQSYYDVGRLVLLAVTKDGIAQKVTRTSEGMSVDGSFKGERDSIGRSITDLVNEIENSKPQAGDLVIVYLAGHGVARKLDDVEKWYFMARDSNRAQVDDDTTISAGFIRKKLVASIDSRKDIKILIFVDACRDRDITFGKARERARSDLMTFADVDLNATVFVATSTDSPSFEFSQQYLSYPKHSNSCDKSVEEPTGAGAFTHVMLSLFKMAAAGAQKKIDLTGMLGSLRDGVAKICSKQRPDARFGDPDSYASLLLAR
jgi:hypothetical protein